MVPQTNLLLWQFSTCCLDKVLPYLWRDCWQWVSTSDTFNLCLTLILHSFKHNSHISSQLSNIITYLATYIKVVVLLYFQVISL